MLVTKHVYLDNCLTKKYLSAIIEQVYFVHIFMFYDYGCGVIFVQLVLELKSDCTNHNYSVILIKYVTINLGYLQSG